MGSVALADKLEHGDVVVGFDTVEKGDGGRVSLPRTGPCPRSRIETYTARRPAGGFEEIDVTVVRCMDCGAMIHDPPPPRPPAHDYDQGVAFLPSSSFPDRRR